VQCRALIIVAKNWITVLNGLIPMFKSLIKKSQSVNRSSVGDVWVKNIIVFTVNFLRIMF